MDDERRAGDALEETSRPLPIELELLGDRDFRCRLQADREQKLDYELIVWSRRAQAGKLRGRRRKPFALAKMP